MAASQDDAAKARSSTDAPKEQGMPPKPADDPDSGISASFEEARKNEGLGEHGCKHYRRRCQIRAPCCGLVFGCRHCHNEEQAEKPLEEQHEIPRHQVEQVICSLCHTEQKVQQFCTKCGVCMGQYFCGVCKFFDDDVRKGQWHCEDCGICRVGGREAYFHCPSCGACYALSLKGNHKCVEKAMHQNCPVCFEYLYDSLQRTAVLEKCGHTLHMACLDSLLEHASWFRSCPICSKSIGDVAGVWRRMDEEVEATIMPPEYQNREISILCNDCNASSSVLFHVVGLKCRACGSYNTRQ